MCLFGINISHDANPITSFSVYPAIEQSKNVQTSLNPTVSVFVSWKLPKWDVARDGCGDVSGVKACPEGHGKPDMLHNRCFRPECPVCYKAWSNREGNHVIERLEAGEVLYHRVGKKLYRVRHIAFSPPQDMALKSMASVDGFKGLRSEAVKVMKKAGVLGGCIIFHSHRKHFVEGVPVWYYSPHFHVLGYGYLVSADKFYEDTGWVYKNKGVRNTVGGTVSYLLTHAGLGYVGDKRVFHCVTWFGIMGYSRMVIKSDTRRVVYEKCPVCDAELHQYDVGYCEKSDYSDRDKWQDMGYYVHVVRVRTFMLRDYKRKGVQERLGADFG